MSERERTRQTLIAHFSPFVNRRNAGIFTRKTRQKLLGLMSMSGKGLAKNEFWYNVRNSVKGSLTDLELFVETAEKSQLDQVLTRKSLEPVIAALFQGFTAYSETQPDPNRADIADMLILWGFRYWKDKTGSGLTLSHERTLEEAVDLSDYLLQSVKGQPYGRPREPFTRI